jgi:multicomponent Na+:H+ antiporter subunit G
VIWTDLASIALCVLGSGFYLAGTVGLLRFPDSATRLHALTKADNLGLGFVVLGLAVRAGTVTDVFQLLLVWAITLLAGTNACSLLGSRLMARGSGANAQGG